MRDPGAWRPSFLPGSESLSTPALGRAHAVISRVPAGTRIARHGHSRRELTYVLDGELVEDGTRRLGPGELLAPEIGSEHEISVGGTDDCLVVFAILDASA
jgi:anti-sigma factor ChrR (cupin superfamily)